MTAYLLCEEGEGYDVRQFRTPEAALRAAKRGVDRRAYTSTSTVYVRVAAVRQSDGEEFAGRVRLDPPEPTCGRGRHAWIEVSGSRRTTGPWAAWSDRCEACGVERHTDTGATDPDTGHRGIEVVSYGI